MWSESRGRGSGVYVCNNSLIRYPVNVGPSRTASSYVPTYRESVAEIKVCSFCRYMELHDLLESSVPWAIVFLYLFFHISQIPLTRSLGRLPVHNTEYRAMAPVHIECDE